MDALWPDDDVAAMRNRGRYFQGAAICRRGHVEHSSLDPTRERASIAEKCPSCGSDVLTACPNCNLRIRGRLHSPGVVSMTPYPRPSFCDGCGAAYPWATRIERIYELENLLDQEEIDQADRVVIQADLARLRTEDLSASDEKRVWERIKSRAGSALTSGPVQRVMEGVVSAAIRSQLGL